MDLCVCLEQTLKVSVASCVVRKTLAKGTSCKVCASVDVEIQEMSS